MNPAIYAFLGYTIPILLSLISIEVYYLIKQRNMVPTAVRAQSNMMSNLYK